MRNPELSPNERIFTDRGARAPLRVAIGAFADGILKFHRNCMRPKDMAGVGAGHDTRGRVCSPDCFGPAVGEDLGRKTAAGSGNPGGDTAYSERLQAASAPTSVHQFVLLCPHAAGGLTQLLAVKG